MPTKTPKPPKSVRPPQPGNRRGTGLGAAGTPPPVAYQFQPGQSGNLAGRPQGDQRVRKIILEALRHKRAEAVRAMETRLGSPKYVQDVLELLARLEGELSKDAAGEGRGIAILILNNTGDQPLDPETFRAAALRRVGEGPGARPTEGSHV